MPTLLSLPSISRDVKNNSRRTYTTRSDDNFDDLSLDRGSRVVFILCTAAIVIVHIASLILKH